MYGVDCRVEVLHVQTHKRAFTCKGTALNGTQRPDMHRHYMALETARNGMTCTSIARPYTKQQTDMCNTGKQHVWRRLSGGAAHSVLSSHDYHNHMLPWYGYRNHNMIIIIAYYPHKIIVIACFCDDTAYVWFYDNHEYGYDGLVRPDHPSLRCTRRMRS